MNNNQTKPINQIKPNRFHLKAWQWVLILAVVAVIVGGVFVFWNNGTQVSPPDQNDIRQAIKQANYCDTSDDCVFLGEYCPFSNSWETYVNKAEKQRLQKMIEEYNKNKKKATPLCKPSICYNISPVQCVEGKCYVECQDYGEVIISVYQINQNPQLYRNKSLSVSGKILMSEITYSDIPPEPGGIKREIFLQSEDTSIALDIKNFTQDYKSFKEKYDQKQVKVKAKVRQEGDYNPILEAEDISIVQEVAITTDKTEYQSGENVEIILVNNSQNSIDIKDEQYISEGVADLEKKVGDGWQKIDLIAIPKIMANQVLLPGASYTYKWDQYVVDMKSKASPGIYRFKFTFDHVGAVYSNEFEIKEKISQSENYCEKDEDCVLSLRNDCCNPCTTEAVNRIEAESRAKWREENCYKEKEEKEISCPQVDCSVDDLYADKMFKLFCFNNQCTKIAFKSGKEGEHCQSNLECQTIDCSKYDTPVKEGYKPYCVEGKCKCMCYGCD